MDKQLEHVIMIFLVLQDMNMRVNRIVSSHESTFLYFFGVNDYYADVEIESDGTILAAMSKRTGIPQVWEVSPDNDSVKLTLSKIRAFIVCK